MTARERQLTMMKLGIVDYRFGAGLDGLGGRSGYP